MVKNPPDNAGDTSSIPGSGRSSGEGNGNPLQYSSLRNPIDRGAWWATVHGVTKESDTTATKQMCTCVCMNIHTHTHTHKCISQREYMRVKNLIS